MLCHRAGVLTRVGVVRPLACRASRVAGKKALEDAHLAPTGTDIKQLNLQRCGILIGSAMGGMTSFSNAVEALELAGEEPSQGRRRAREGRAALLRAREPPPRGRGGRAGQGCTAEGA